LQTQKCIQAKNVADIVTALMTKLAIAVAAGLAIAETISAPTC